MTGMNIENDDTPRPSLADPSSSTSAGHLLTGATSRKASGSINDGDESVSAVSTVASISPQATNLGFQSTLATMFPAVDPSMVAQHGSVISNPVKHISRPRQLTPTTHRATKLGDWEDMPVTEPMDDQFKESEEDGRSKAKNDRVVAVNIDHVCTRGKVTS